MNMFCFCVFTIVWK